MKLIGALAALIAAVFSASNARAQESEPNLAFVIHGGAGAQAPGKYTAEKEEAFKAKLTEAVRAGYGVLEEGGAALDAVTAAIVILEDSPLFNAGKGAVFTREGVNELDASIMDGRDKNAGAIAGVTRVKNPILLARAVMENSDHVMFAREGAERFAEAQGLDFVDPAYFHTERRRRDLDEAIAKESREGALPAPFKYGTVGAVALDASGDLAAGTSTGGMTAKRFGRVGDSPIPGAGVYADNGSCAVSSTGHGEFFIRLTLARDICAQVEYAGKTLNEAADDLIHNRLEATGATGGVVALSPSGEIAMTFNSAGMFRAAKTADTEIVAIYGEE